MSHQYRRLREVPSEIDLPLGDLLADEGHDLGIAEPAAGGPGALVGHQDLLTGLDQPLELEVGDQLCIGPAALEVGFEVDSRVGGAVEDKILAQVWLD